MPKCKFQDHKAAKKQITLLKKQIEKARRNKEYDLKNHLEQIMGFKELDLELAEYVKENNIKDNALSVIC
jgi:hypothetical protein